MTTFSLLQFIAIVCIVSNVDCQKIVGLEGTYRLSRAEINGRLVSTPMWKEYILEIQAIPESEAMQRGYRKGLFTRNKLSERAQIDPTVKENHERAPDVKKNSNSFVNPHLTASSVSRMEPFEPVEATNQFEEVSYYSLTFYMKNVINAMLVFGEDGKWTIIEEEKALSTQFGEDNKAELFMEKILESFSCLTLKHQNKLYVYGYGGKMVKFAKYDQVARTVE